MKLLQTLIGLLVVGFLIWGESRHLAVQLCTASDRDFWATYAVYAAILVAFIVGVVWQGWHGNDDPE